LAGKYTTMTAIDVSPLDAGLLDAVVRLVRLLDSPNDAGFLAPLLQREIVYRLLKGAQRGRLAHIAALESNTQRITEASNEQPFLGLVLSLDPTLVGSVMVEAGRPAPRGQSAATAMDVSPLDADLLDAVARLVRLIDDPADARFLAPMIKREVVYWLLVGEQGDTVRHIATLGDTNRIARAIDRLRHDFERQLRISDLARDLGMSTSSFHQHFKAVTAMSPLEFQKQLRLQEARRLMLGEDVDAASAGYRVGYHDASHFSREYKRLFGAPPLRDVERLRGAATQSASL